MTSNDRLLSTSRTLPIALLRAREVVMQPIREMLQGIQLTEQKWRILRTLDELGEVEQSSIAKEACLLLPSLTRTLRGMEEAGLVARRGDAQDRRKTMVQITPAGKALLTENIATSLALYARIETQLGPDKLRQLLDLLEDLQALDLGEDNPDKTRPEREG